MPRKSTADLSAVIRFCGSLRSLNLVVVHINAHMSHRGQVGNTMRKRRERASVVAFVVLVVVVVVVVVVLVAVSHIQLPTPSKERDS